MPAVLDPLVLVWTSTLLVSAPSAAAAPRPDSLAVDTTRVVRTLEETVVRATRLDVASSETRRRLTREALRALPVDGLAQALALQTGVVLDGELVHVRGARPGELSVELDGITLNEPLRGRALEVPLIALESAELTTGGLGPEHGGGLAGTLVLRPVAAGPRWQGRTSWQTDGRRGTHYDRAGGLAAGPLGAGLGLALAGEALLDDGATPNLRTLERTRILGRSFGWRADNRLTALARLTAVERPGRFAVQSFLARRVEEPFNPMFSLAGYTTPCADPDCNQAPSFSPTPGAGLRFAPYNAADHAGVTETRHATVIASTERVVRRDRMRLSAGWSTERRVTSLDGTTDERYLADAPQFGNSLSPGSDPFHVFLGSNPYFRLTHATRFEARAEWRREQDQGGLLSAGMAATHERVDLREIDRALSLTYDSLRVYSASAPGAYAWLGSRWVRPGLIADAGVRGEWFSPGPDAERTPHTGTIHDFWIVSPRVGLVFPLSRQDAMQFSYVRISQPPPRDFLYDDRSQRMDPRRPQGNPGLSPSTSISYEISFKHRAGELWSGRAGLFYRDLFRQVSARSVPGPGPTGLVLRYTSDDAGHAQGFELTAAREDPGRTRLELGYTWMIAEGSESFEDGLPFYPLTLPQPPPIGEHPLAWDQRQRFTLAAAWTGRLLTASWSTVLGSGLPWTPASVNAPPTDLSLVHSKRLGWSTVSDLSLRARPLRGGWRPVTVGLEVRNVFDFRGQSRVSEDGYPNHSINTAFDDYAAYRTATGLGGAAYWDDADGKGNPGWVRVFDPRLDVPPRAVRLRIETEW